MKGLSQSPQCLITSAAAAVTRARSFYRFRQPCFYVRIGSMQLIVQGVALRAHEVLRAWLILTIAAAGDLIESRCRKAKRFQSRIGDLPVNSSTGQSKCREREGWAEEPIDVNEYD